MYVYMYGTSLKYLQFLHELLVGDPAQLLHHTDERILAGSQAGGEAVGFHADAGVLVRNPGQIRVEEHRDATQLNGSDV